MVSRLVSIIAMGIVVACAQVIMAQCNTVDAVTTASFKITGGQACSTSATLNWSFNQNNGTMTIRWGTSTSYGSQKSVYTANPISITGLTKKTKYFYAVDGLFENITHTYTRSSFTTSGSTGIRTDDFQRTILDNGAITLALGRNSMILPFIHGELFYTMQLFTLSGASIGNKTVLSLKNGTHQAGLFNNITPGMYLVRISWTNGSMQQKVFLGK